MNDQKKFGVWMDNHHATVIGKTSAEQEFTVLAHVNNETSTENSSEKNEHQHEKALKLKFFKTITSHMQNAEVVHVTGTGQAQEQFIHHLAETPQFKNTKTSECTSNKMSDERLLEFLGEKLK
ncbi:MAG: hypothetical protein WKF88_11510 [Ferruginibacter sp.]